MLKKISLLYLIFVILLPIVFSVFIFNDFDADKPSQLNIKNDKCTYNIQDYVEILNHEKIEYKVFPIELSIYPEIANLKCINKVLLVNQGDQYNVGIGTSTRFYSVLQVFFTVFLIFSWLFLKRKNTYEVINLIIIFNFLFGNIFYFYKNKATSTLAGIVIINLIYYLSKNIEIHKIERISFRRDINLLRAIAVISVVIYHADFGIFGGGWLGVDLFFVISGYLISNIIISEINNSSFSFKHFYLRRARRILPGLYSVLVISSIVSYIMLFPKQMLTFSESLRSSILFFSNYFFRTFDFYTTESAKSLSLLHTWSLSIEEQFYILFPIVTVFLVKHFKKDFPAILITLLICSIYFNNISPDISQKFYNFEFRVWEILIGVVVMISSFHKFNLKSKILYNSSFIFLVFSPFFFTEDSITKIYPRIAIIIAAAFILMNKDNSNSKIINYLEQNKILVTIGVTSYSIYLIHQPLFSFALISSETVGVTLLAIHKAGLLLAVFIFSYINYILVEKSFMKETTSLYPLMIIFVFLLAFTYYSENSSGFINRYDEIPNKIVNYSLNAFEFNIEDNDCQNSQIEDVCIFSNENSYLNVVGVGDSHLAAIGKFLSGKNTFYEYVHIGENGCIFSVNKIPDNACVNKDLEKLKQTLSSYENSVFVLSSRWEYYINYYDSIGFNIFQDIEETFSFLLEGNNKIILVYPIPEQEIRLIDSYLSNKITFGDTIYADKEIWLTKSFKTNNFFDSQINQNVFGVKSTRLFCDLIKKNKCIGAIDDKVYYYDNNHLTEEGAEIIGEEILKILSNFK